MADDRTGRSLSEHLLLPPPPSSAVVVAINGKKRSKYVVFWALEKFIPEGVTDFKLVYVRPPITSVPTPMGNTIPISEVRDDVASAYRQEVEWNTSEMLRPYMKMCEHRKVLVEVLVLESDDIAAEIAEEITRSGITKLVIGLSLRGYFSRKLDMSSMIAAAAPSFCTVYVVSKFKLASVRPPENSKTNGTIGYESSSTSGSTGDNPSLQSGFQDLLSFVSEAESRVPPPSLSPKQTNLPGTSTALVRMDTSSTDTDPSVLMSTENYEGFSTSETYQAPNWGSRWRHLDERREIPNMDWDTANPDNNSWASHQASNMSEGLLSMHSATDNHVSMSFEIEKLKAELKHAQEMYAMAQTETAGASRKLEELNQQRHEEWERLEELRAKEEEAKEAATKEKKRYELAAKEAEKVRELVAKEALQRRKAEIKAERDAKEKEKLQVTLVTEALQYQHFGWEEIVAATSNFSDDLKIGFGAYGTVYKCSLHHTIAAVKVLHAEETQLSKQFDQELQILSKIRHPHLVLLLGACPERGCLVYEYMDNGSLEDRLMLVNDTPPIPWFDRFRIAWEVASALVFLHKSKPKPIIHRDLKPGNILLDGNYVSKLGDVGLSTMVNQDDPSSKLTIYKKTSPVGTLCYIDPEYQRTGMISTKSDVYSLGIVILQLITAKPAIAITQIVEDAIADDEEFMEVLDAKAGPWPITETREMAALGLCCTELRRRDRPDLEDQILPVLERLRKAAEKASQSSLSMARTSPPSHFICPLLKDVMNEPCVAADGYTYDRECIEEWFRDHNTSPVTNLPLPNKNLLPNYTLYAAITEWKSKRK